MKKIPPHKGIKSTPVKGALPQSQTANRVMNPAEIMYPKKKK